MKKIIISMLMLLLAFAMIISVSCAEKQSKKEDAQAEDTEKDPYSLAEDEETEYNSDEANLARQRAPMLGVWTATATDDTTGEETATTFTFHEDGTVTSVTFDGKNAFGGIIKKVLWRYDVKTGNLIMEYTDIRGMATEYIFDVNIAHENYIIIRAISPENEVGKKLALTR